MGDIAYLVSALKSSTSAGHLSDSDPEFRSKLINNIVYHVPRVQCVQDLYCLANAILNSRIWGNGDAALKLYDMSRSFMHWKLQMSEPTISISTFYETWDTCIKRCPSWNINKLGILSGILSTKNEFLQLNQNYFIDDRGIVSNYYKHWRKTYFIYGWNASLVRYYSDPEGEMKLILLYVPINVSNDNIPWPVVMRSLMNLMTMYTRQEKHVLFNENDFLNRNINNVAKTLQLATLHCEDGLLAKILNTFCGNLYDLSVNEQNRNTNREVFKDVYYTNILITAVMFFKSILDAKQDNIPNGWRHQIIICLFYTHFIAREFTTEGFRSYEFVYNVAITGLTDASCQEPQLYLDLVGMMTSSIWNVSGNTVQDAKLLFLLEFIEYTIPQYPNMTDTLMLDVMKQLIYRNIHNRDTELKEATNTMAMAAISNGSPQVLQWKQSFIPKYLRLTSQEYLQEGLSIRQFLIINKRIAETIESMDIHGIIQSKVSSDTLNYLLTTSSDKSLSPEQRCTMAQCLIIHAIHASKTEQLHWLTKCYSLVTVQTRGTLLPVLWETVLHLNSDAALHWWYQTVVTSSKF
ncbi:hypothetical protein TPHA_0M00530 [Tetrapisispora phaffii CBS 4417]|uniref:Uncharacterized protein n=1 Tax=Tetrapisispora phaffii (strain ATCC 24235 / CBS 4417 / NBRC 1672 / NRRL Y-8282 / UCD 70-5) TaxID=1071381 RepID=G8C0B3_TETPH|nr:hypothetical protein TPHA_0M00530 [Tetrapisispora phaffii CBS 4417]CCE65628.1 hypothetical protein TPHA_0M00530 [Tetrapisispora phaffii CBS 4417]